LTLSRLSLTSAAFWSHPFSLSLIRTHTMSLVSVVTSTRPASKDETTSSVDAQLASLMEDYVRTTQLQNSLKKRIRDILKEKEAEARKREDEAREALRKAEQEAQDMERAVMMAGEEMKEVEMMDGEELEEVGLKIEEAKPSRPLPPMPILESNADMGVQMREREEEKDEMIKLNFQARAQYFREKKRSQEQRIGGVEKRRRVNTIEITRRNAEEYRAWEKGREQRYYNRAPLVESNLFPSPVRVLVFELFRLKLTITLVAR
jgi:hypothetical protein